MWAAVAATSNSGFDPSISASATVPCRRLAVDDDHVLERREAIAGLEDHGQERLLDDGHAGGCVGAQVHDLLGRIGHVDRERGRAEHRRGEIDDVKFRPVAEHDRHRVAAPDPQLGQAAGQRVDAREQLGPRERDAVVGHPNRHHLGVVCRGAPQRLGQRRRVDRPPCCRRDRAALHALLVCLGDASVRLTLSQPRRPQTRVARGPSGR